MTELELTAMRGRRDLPEPHDEYGSIEECGEFNVDEWVAGRTQEIFESLQLSPSQIDLAFRVAKDLDRCGGELESEN